KSFRNWLPNASFKYSFSRFKSLSLFYAASTNQPSMSQLQPVPDLTNPLYIREGNPDLKQEFIHTLRGVVNLVTPYKNKNTFIYFTASTTSNKIVNYDKVDLSTGVKRTKPVNVNGVYTINGNFDYGLPVHFLKGSLGLGSTMSVTRNKQLINVD